MKPNPVAKKGKAAAKAPDFRICPACQTRNKAKWEFCARCGESLVDVPLGMPEGMAAADVAPPPPRSSGGGGGTAAVLLAVAALATAGYFLIHPRPAPTPPNSDIFAMPTLPPSPGPVPPPRPPDRANELYVEGRQRIARRDFEGAVAPLTEAVGLAGDRAEYHSLLARALWETGSKDQAVESYRQAAQLSRTPYTLFDLARALEGNGSRDDALPVYDQAIELAPRDPEILRAKGTALIRAKRAGEAIEVLRTVVELEPENPTAIQDLARALDQGGNPAEAIDAYRRVVEKVPQATITRGLLAEALFKNGQKDEAVAVMREGVTSAPESPLIHRGLGSLLERSGQPREAAAAYREYARLAPNAADAAQLVERASKLEQQASPAPSSPPAPQSS